MPGGAADRGVDEEVGGHGAWRGDGTSFFSQSRALELVRVFRTHLAIISMASARGSAVAQ